MKCDLSVIFVLSVVFLAAASTVTAEVSHQMQYQGYLTAGGSWQNGSSRTFKDNFQPLDPNDLLTKISELPVEAWQYTDTEERHIGRVCEDLAQAFDVGAVLNGKRDDKYLSPGDVAVVALTGVKELIHENQKLKQVIEELRQRVAYVEEAKASKGGK